MTEQQITEFDRWFDQFMDPELNLTPGEKELCRHAWQSALSHAEGEAQPVGWMCVDENGVRDGEIVTHRSELDEADWLPGFRAVPVYTHPAPQVADMDHRVEDLKEALQAVVDEDRDTPEAYLNRDHAKQVLARFGDPSSLPEYSRGWNDAMEVKAASQVPEGWRAKVLELCLAVENEDDLPPVKYALKCGRLINEVKDMLAAAPTAPAGEPAEWPEPQDAMTAQLQDAARKAGFQPHEVDERLALFAGHFAGREQPVSGPDGLPEATRKLLESLYGTLERATAPADESAENVVDSCMASMNQFLERFPDALDAPMAPAPVLDALRHLLHNAEKSGAEMGLALDVAREALSDYVPAPDEREPRLLGYTSKGQLKNESERPGPSVTWIAIGNHNIPVYVGGAQDEREIAVIRQLSEIARNSDYEVEVMHDDYVDITRFETDIAEHIADWLDKQADTRLRAGKGGE